LTSKTVIPPAGGTGAKSWFSSNWVAVCISSLALITSIYSNWETRKHNRLSVRPHISLGFIANDKGAGWQRSIDGAGPAIVNAFEVTVDDKPVHSWDEVLSLCCGLNLVAVHGTLAIPTPGTYLLPNDTRTILWVDAPENARKALAANSGRVKIRWTYCSVYEQCWEASLDPQQLEQPEVQKRTPAMTFTVSKEWVDAFSGTTSPQPAEHK
jgi:hypothetical protein